MHLKNKFVSLYMVLSVLVLGMIMSCSEPTNPQIPAQINEVPVTKIESIDEGIKLSWEADKIPENTVRINIESWAPGLFFLGVFEINDMTKDISK